MRAIAQLPISLKLIGDYRGFFSQMSHASDNDKLFTGIINVTVTAIHKSTSGSGCSRAELLIAFLKPFLLQAR